MYIIILAAAMSMRIYNLVRSTKGENDIGRLQAPLLHLRLVVPDHFLQAHADGPARLPIEGLLGASGIRAALLGIVGGHGLVDDVNPPLALDTIFVLDLLNDLADKLSELADGELVAVANVNRT